jgi:tetratricopeptide (TPR) repeat protein
MCVILMTLSAVALACRLRPRAAVSVWAVLLAAGVANGLYLNLQPRNLIHPNLTHYYLGAKYDIPYSEFYRLVNAALARPQVGMRDLKRPDHFVRPTTGEQRAYYIGLMREQGVEFDPLVSLSRLAAQADYSGAISREAEKILERHLPASRIKGFRRDVVYAVTSWPGGDLTRDAGFNGSPFYVLVRHLDPTLYGTYGRMSSWVNLAWQCLAMLVSAWVMGAALKLDAAGRMAMAAIAFASVDFVSFAFPGLVVANLFIPVAVAMYGARTRAPFLTAGGIAWSGLVKLFPFILLLPAFVRLLRAGLERLGKRQTEIRPRPWASMVLATAATTLVLVLASTLVGRSWQEFLQKIAAQFGVQGIAGNNVSLAHLLSALGIDSGPIPIAYSLFAILVLAAVFVPGKDEEVRDSLPRRFLVLLAAMVWLSRAWLNYYSLAALFLLPFVARRRRFGAALAVLAMAFAALLPDFGSPQLAASRFLLVVKLLPYILLPGWLVMLEVRASRLSYRVQVVMAGCLAALVVLTAVESWRIHTVRRATDAAYAYLDKGDAKRALENFDAASRWSPRNALIHAGCAVATAVAGNTTRAQYEFEQAIRLDPANPRIRQNLARLLLGLNRVGKAANQLEIAQRFAPDDATILFDLARARLQQNRPDEAVSLLTRARELDPSDRQVENLLTRMEARAP